MPIRYANILWWMAPIFLRKKKRKSFCFRILDEFLSLLSYLKKKKMKNTLMMRSAGHFILSLSFAFLILELKSKNTTHWCVSRMLHHIHRRLTVDERWFSCASVYEMRHFFPFPLSLWRSDNFWIPVWLRNCLPHTNVVSQITMLGQITMNKHNLLKK